MSRSERSRPEKARSRRRPKGDDELPASIPALMRTLKIGYRAEPRLLVLAFVMLVFTSVPDALLALWLAMLANGTIDRDRSQLIVAAVGLALSTTGTWYLRVVFDRVQRRFRDRVSIALETHVARLQASVATIEHHERPEHLDRLTILRDHVFALDHLFLSLFTTLGWVVRLAVTVGLLMSIDPWLGLLVVAAVPTMVTATWRPGVERAVEESMASRPRLARQLFEVVTSAPPAKEVRVTGNGRLLAARRHDEFEAWYGPVARTRSVSAAWHMAGWAVFGLAYVGAIAVVAGRPGVAAGSVLLVLAAGSRLTAYVGAAVGELGFLRSIWLDSSRRLAWLEDYAAGIDDGADLEPPTGLERGIRFDHVSFAYPGTERLVLDDVDLELPAGAVVAVVGENGAGKTTLVKLLAKLYAPTAGRILVDDVDLARIPTPAWRERLAGAFQDFFRFELLAATAVGVGDEPRIDDRSVITGAVGRAGADDVVERLSDGLDTQLGPAWDGGVEVSHGQWQKLALARGFMREAPLVLVLDEPTSALDAETEHALFERYAAAASREGGGITMLVSHRFSTVRMADVIVVLDGNRVAEVGSHDDLMAIDGTYADLYRIQATAYA